MWSLLSPKSLQSDLTDLFNKMCTIATAHIKSTRSFVHMIDKYVYIHPVIVGHLVVSVKPEIATIHITKKNTKYSV